MSFPPRIHQETHALVQRYDPNQSHVRYSICALSWRISCNRLREDALGIAALNTASLPILRPIAAYSMQAMLVLAHSLLRTGTR